jgi:hypothetical protein
VTEIRSYRNVFDLERRIYRIDRLRLNPSGVPVRGVVYFLAVLGVGLCASAAPLIGSLVRMIPWYVRDGLAPAASAALLNAITVEGRPSHLAALGILRYVLGPRELHGLRRIEGIRRQWCPHELVLAVDGSEARLRRLRYMGPGAVTIRVPHRLGLARAGSIGRLLGGGPRVRLSSPPGDAGGDGRTRVVALARGVQLEVRP